MLDCHIGGGRNTRVALGRRSRQTLCNLALRTFDLLPWRSAVVFQYALHGEDALTDVAVLDIT